MGPHVRYPWLALLEQTGRAVTAADPMEIAAVKRQLPVLAAALAQQRSHEPAAGLTDVDPMWPLYGALMTNMSNITEAMVEVAAAQPVTADTSIGVS